MNQELGLGQGEVKGRRDAVSRPEDAERARSAMGTQNSPHAVALA